MQDQLINTNYERYPAYKDSGVEWLGAIPEEWKVKRFKFLMHEINERTNKGDEDLLSVSQYTGVTKKSERLDDGDLLTTASSLEGYKIVRKNDLISNIMLAWNGSLGFSNYDGITSPAYSIYRLTFGDCEKYFHYLVRTQIYKAEFKRHSSGVIESRLRLYTDSFFAIWSLLPPLPEQTAIANFLDEKTAKIDQAIVQKEKMIALLQERKQIMIQEAVTGQIKLQDGQWVKRPASEMKDSGVDWIGKIPKHWEVKKLFGICNIVRGNSTFGKEDLLDDGDYVALQYGKSYKVDEVNGEFGYYVNKEYFKDSQVVGFGDTILISTSETLCDLGHSVFYNRIEDGLLGGEQVMLKPKKNIVFKKFIYYTSRIFSRELVKHATGIKVFRFNVNKLKLISIPLTGIEEQKQIAEFIDSSLEKLEDACDFQQSQIQKLKEYKATLIDSAVTGKIRIVK